MTRTRVSIAIQDRKLSISGNPMVPVQPVQPDPDGLVKWQDMKLTWMGNDVIWSG